MALSQDSSVTYLCGKAIPAQGVYSWTAWCTIDGGERVENMDAQVGLGPNAGSYIVLQDNGYLLGPAGAFDNGLRGYSTTHRVTVTADMDRRLVHFFVNRAYVATVSLDVYRSEQIYFMMWVRAGDQDSYELHCTGEVQPPELPAEVQVYVSANKTEKRATR